MYIHIYVYIYLYKHIVDSSHLIARGQYFLGTEMPNSQHKRVKHPPSCCKREINILAHCSQPFFSILRHRFPPISALPSRKFFSRRISGTTQDMWTRWVPLQNTFHPTLLRKRILRISNVASSNPSTNMDGQADPSTAQLAHPTDARLHAKAHPSVYIYTHMRIHTCMKTHVSGYLYVCACFYIYRDIVIYIYIHT